MDPALEASVHHPLSRLHLHAEVAVGRETLALVGPSGAGKSSVLRAVAGLLAPERGRVVLGRRVLFDRDTGVNVPPDRRRIGLMFQEGALFPHMTVGQNVAYGMRGRGRDGRGAVRDVLRRFGIGHLRGARPASLSGGERQRAALARAVASGPDALLLDEPLSALDPATRGDVAIELAAHLESLDLPTVLVSHEFSDVVGLASRVAVIERGAVVQTGTAAELLEAPASAFVAAFTGVNYYRGTARASGHLTEIRTTPASSALFSTEPANGAVGVVVYPWDVALSQARPDGSALNALTGPVRRIAGVGNRVRVTVGSDPPIVAEVTDQSAARMGLAPGVGVVATWKATGTRIVR
jgi:ABC-type sulfate/molybdate transport systems ATPase subunit